MQKRRWKPVVLLRKLLTLAICIVSLATLFAVHVFRYSKVPNFSDPYRLPMEKLATVEEVKPFMNHASQRAALDHIVSVESDVFIPSYDGNMARAVEGHRRFRGHRKTISPDRKPLIRLFDKLELGKMKEGKDLANQIIELHQKRQGSARKRKSPVWEPKGWTDSIQKKLFT